MHVASDILASGMAHRLMGGKLLTHVGVDVGLVCMQTRLAADVGGHMFPNLFNSCLLNVDHAGLCAAFDKAKYHALVGGACFAALCWWIGLTLIFAGRLTFAAVSFVGLNDLASTAHRLGL